MFRHLRGIYLITPDFDALDPFIPRLEAALEGGVALVQYRNKRAAQAEQVAQATAILDCCRRFGVPMVVNDHVDVAASVGADGVHLGSTDGSIAGARRELGESALIGASCYDQFALAQSAARQGASYVAFGAFAPSSTKPGARQANPAVLAEATELGLPRVAIGGIDADNAPALVAAGADLLAVISHVFSAPDPARAVRALRAAFNNF